MHCASEKPFLLPLEVKAIQRLNYQYSLCLEELKPFSLNVKYASVNFLLPVTRWNFLIQYCLKFNDMCFLF